MAAFGTVIALCCRHNIQSPAESLGLFHRRIHCGFLGSTCTVCFAALRRDLRSANAARLSSSGTCIRGESGGCDRLCLGLSQAGRQVPRGYWQAHPDIHGDNRAPNRSHCNSSARLPCRVDQSPSSTLALDALVKIAIPRPILLFCMYVGSIQVPVPFVTARGGCSWSRGPLFSPTPTGGTSCRQRMQTHIREERMRPSWGKKL